MRTITLIISILIGFFLGPWTNSSIIFAQGVDNNDNDGCLNFFSLIRGAKSDDELRASLAKNQNSIRIFEFPQLIKEIRDVHGDGTMSESHLHRAWVHTQAQHVITQNEGRTDSRPSEDRLLSAVDLATWALLTEDDVAFLKAEVEFLVEFNLYYQSMEFQIAYRAADHRSEEELLAVIERAKNLGDFLDTQLRKLKISHSARTTLLLMVKFVNQLRISNAKFHFERTQSIHVENIWKNFTFEFIERKLASNNEEEVWGAYEHFLSLSIFYNIMERSLSYKQHDVLKFQNIMDQTYLYALRLAILFNSASAIELGRAAMIDFQSTLNLFHGVREEYAKTPDFLRHLQRARSKVKSVISQFEQREDWASAWNTEGDKALASLDDRLRTTAKQHLQEMSDSKKDEALVDYQGYVLRYYRELERRKNPSFRLN